MKSMGRTCRKAFLAGILSVSLFRPPAPTVAQDTTEVELERFFDSDYTWCDAQLLSAYWQQGVTEAKARIGRKIGWGNEQYIEEYLNEARVGALFGGMTCSYTEAGYTFEDADALAMAWDVSLEEAKARMESLLFNGNAGVIDASLAQIRSHDAHPDPHGQPDSDPVATFWDRGYTACDANLIAAFWQEDVMETKHTLGTKIQAGNMEGVNAAFEQARAELNGGSLDEFGCSYWDEGYSYDDMVALSEHWGISVDDTKARVENKLLWGLNDVVQEALGDIGSGH